MAISILERSPNILMPEVVDRYLEEVGQNGHLGATLRMLTGLTTLGATLFKTNIYAV